MGKLALSAMEEVLRPVRLAHAGERMGRAQRLACLQQAMLLLAPHIIRAPLNSDLQVAGRLIGAVINCLENMAGDADAR